MVTEETPTPTTFVTEWTSIVYCKTCDLFFANISGMFSMIIDYLRFPHSSSMSTSLGESSKFLMSSITIQSSSSSTITFFF